MKGTKRAARFALPLALSLGVAMTALTPAIAKDLLTVDLVNEPSSLDPHQQWNPDSYYVYRNIFDNMVTRGRDRAADRDEMGTDQRHRDRLHHP
jgi:peptide/nickel transport system substrate-binding protein